MIRDVSAINIGQDAAVMKVQPIRLHLRYHAFENLTRQILYPAYISCLLHSSRPP